MGCPFKIFFKITFLSTFLFSLTSGQIIFKELPKYEIKSSDSLFFDLSLSRNIIPLNGMWNVYSAGDDENNKVSVGIPSVFKGKADLVFEKTFTLNESQINSHNIHLYFLGLNYTADISVNNVIIYRHSGGEYPFHLPLPRDILYKDKNNILSVKLFYELDSENTIPVKQRFLFPQNYGGILRDVYLSLMPNISLSEINISSNYNPGNRRAKIRIDAKIENKEFRKTSDTIALSPDFLIRTVLISPDGSVSGSSDLNINLPVNKEQNIVQEIELSSPVLWSPNHPVSYTVRIEMRRGDRIIDVSKRSLSIYSFVDTKDSLLFNGSSFVLKGVTYIPSFYGYGSLAGYPDMERDIRIIKDAGFNTIRFSGTVPHPYYLYLCERYGLLAFIEIPVSAIPPGLAGDGNFISRSKNYLSGFIKGYKKYSAVAAIGFGGSYLPDVPQHLSLINNLAGLTKSSFNVLTYASFVGIKISHLDQAKTNIDLYGIEFFNESILEYENEIKEAQEKLGAGRVFISSATYVVNTGNSDGYVNDGSYEAQAKYFEELIEYADNNPLAGFFINTMFDYRGEFNSLISGYSKENIYHIGLSGEDRNTSRLAYKVISAKLHNGERVTIPIGSKKDNAPMVYIIFGLVLALFMGVLVNSGRKFREDSSRALLRPYNFFADVRDQRIMSGPHTAMLAIVVSAIAALLVSNLLSYLKENIFFEKLLLSFGSHSIMQMFNYLAWHPLISLLWLSIAFITLLLFLTIMVKIASFFVRNRVYFSSVFFTVIWSFLPLVLLIPVGIVLYRLLNAGVGNLYIYGGFIVFAIWIFYRLMKGIYVIFDVNAASVYFYSILLVLFITGGFVFYFEINNSFIDFLNLTFKQYYSGGL